MGPPHIKQKCMSFNYVGLVECCQIVWNIMYQCKLLVVPCRFPLSQSVVVSPHFIGNKCIYILEQVRGGYGVGGSLAINLCLFPITGVPRQRVPGLVLWGI